jgi:hypothetical protein
MLYISYDNNKHNDGAGAQLLRIVSAYLIAKYYNIGYIHSPLTHISNYGLICLENKTTDILQVKRYNNLINFISDTHKHIDNIIELKEINSDIIKKYKENTEDILLKVTYPIFCINSNPDILNLINCINFDWCNSVINTSNIKIGIHIRRGDILFIEKEIRYLDNQYYIRLMKQIDIIFKDIPHEFHIYTENPTKKFNVTDEYRDDLKGINTFIEPDTYEDFSEFNNIIWHINTNPVDTFIELCNSDMLITSISAYSYLAGILNKKAIIIQNKKMNSPPKKNCIVIENNIISDHDINYIINHYNTSININKPIKYISGGALGDFIHQLSVIKEKYIQTGRKGILYISHTARDTDKFPFGLEQAYNDTYKLIINQEYIESYHIHNNEPFDINLSSWVINQPLFKNNWHHIFSEEYGVNWSNSKYLNIEYNNKYKDYILFSSSIKRFNSSIDYNKLFEKLPYMPIFVTTIKSEYEHFKYKTGFNNIEYIYYDNLYDLYVAINSCKLFIGNLSSPLTVAQGVCKSRICILQPNINDNDNIHMKNLDKIWDDCLYIYNSDDLYKISNFCNNLFKV